MAPTGHGARRWLRYAYERGLPKKKIVQGAALRGIFVGKTITFGNKVSHAENKSRRTWKPNVLKKKFYLPLLDRTITINVTAHALRTFDKFGGLQNYLLNTPSHKIDPGFTTDIRREVIAARDAVERRRTTPGAPLPMPPVTLKLSRVMVKHLVRFNPRSSLLPAALRRRDVDSVIHSLPRSARMYLRGQALSKQLEMLPELESRANSLDAQIRHSLLPDEQAILKRGKHAIEKEIQHANTMYSLLLIKEANKAYEGSFPYTAGVSECAAANREISRVKLLCTAQQDVFRVFDRSKPVDHKQLDPRVSLLLSSASTIHSRLLAALKARQESCNLNAQSPLTLSDLSSLYLHLVRRRSALLSYIRVTSSSRHSFRVLSYVRSRRSLLKKRRRQSEVRHALFSRVRAVDDKLRRLMELAPALSTIVTPDVVQKTTREFEIERLTKQVKKIDQLKAVKVEDLHAGQKRLLRHETKIVKLLEQSKHQLQIAETKNTRDANQIA